MLTGFTFNTVGLQTFSESIPSLSSNATKYESSTNYFLWAFRILLEQCSCVLQENRTLWHWPELPTFYPNCVDYLSFNCSYQGHLSGVRRGHCVGWQERLVLWLTFNHRLFACNTHGAIRKYSWPLLTHTVYLSFFCLNHYFSPKSGGHTTGSWFSICFDPTI